MTNRRKPSEVVDVFTILAVLLASRVHTLQLAPRQLFSPACPPALGTRLIKDEEGPGVGWPGAMRSQPPRLSPPPELPDTCVMSVITGDPPGKPRLAPATQAHREREADAGPEADPSLAPERIQTPKSASTEPGGQVPLRLHSTARGLPCRVRTTTIAPTMEDAECSGVRPRARPRLWCHQRKAQSEFECSSKGCPQVLCHALSCGSGSLIPEFWEAWAEFPEGVSQFSKQIGWEDAGEIGPESLSNCPKVTQHAKQGYSLRTLDANHLLPGAPRTPTSAAADPGPEPRENHEAGLGKAPSCLGFVVSRLSRSPCPDVFTRLRFSQHPAPLTLFTLPDLGM
ncbi:unnamed protein product [Rangifer tarandus platyrhynchus]|uniref:Uncharacterized protein n=1 Tax=Rangifer tarandus platyrhynchus TaxID=3082113 RepID=A0ABN8XZP7_RANTA|nr:unnamed protein product [Rangifer tarandus platyrhynchus]